MLKVLYACIKDQHDIRLVALAAFICIFGCLTAINLFVRAREAFGRRRLALATAAAVVLGAGVWATHVVAELAFKPGLPIAYDIDLTALSMVIAVLMAGIGMIIALRFRRPIIGGFVIGAAVGAMHYVGMAALRVPADPQWDAAYVTASVSIGIIGAGAALRVVWLGPAWRYRLWAAALLVAAICGLHFTAMAAIALVPNPLISMPSNVAAPELLALPVAAVTIGIAMFGMAASILEERSARQATYEADQLRRSQEQLARVLRISGVGSIERDLRTEHLEWSAEACKIFGVSTDQIEHTKEYFYGFVHPDDRTRVETALRQSRPGTALPPLEYRILRPDGAERVVYSESELLYDNAGRPISLISAFKDVTEVHVAQKRERDLERQLQHSQKLEALGTLAGGVAHDLNNTLVPILALSRLALDDLPEESPTRADVETIIHASERARDLVKQVLAFSRKQDLLQQEVDLALVAREALQMLRASLPATIQIVERISEVPPLFGDAGELHLVVINLVTNAAQAIGGRVGKIAVSLWPSCETRPSPHMGGAVVCLSVVDTGCGMDEVTLDRIFEPFFTTKCVGQGTGLGLSVVHGIVTSHGGKITVRSQLGKGTEFTLSLPRFDQHRSMAQDEPVAA